jgi:predicted ATPase
MINKVSIRNFRSLRDVQTDLERFTVFVGPNASGKSSILQGLNLLCRAFRQPGGGEDEIRQALSRGASDSVELAAETAGQWYRYRCSSQSMPRGLPVPSQPWSGEGCGLARTSPRP